MYSKANNKEMAKTKHCVSVQLIYISKGRIVPGWDWGGGSRGS